MDCFLGQHPKNGGLFEEQELLSAISAPGSPEKHFACDAASQFNNGKQKDNIYEQVPLFMVAW